MVTSKPRAAAVPRVATTTPPAAGPTSVVVFAEVCSNPFAGASFAVSPTTRGTIAVKAGKKNASAVPNASATAYSCQTATVSVTTSVASSSHQQPAADVRRQHDVAWRVAVGNRPADEHQDRPREGRRHQHRAHREVRPGQLQDEERQRHEVEVVAGQRDRLAEPEKAEVPFAERSEEAHGGQGKGRARGAWLRAS